MKDGELQKVEMGTYYGKSKQQEQNFGIRKSVVAGRIWKFEQAKHWRDK